MLTVTNPRLDPDSTVTGWLRVNASLAAGMTIWALAVLLVAALGQSRNFVDDQWYGLSFMEGIASYTPYGPGSACPVAGFAEGHLCVLGADLQR